MRSLTVTMRIEAGTILSARAIGDVLHAIDPALPVIAYETVDAALSEYVAPTRFYVLSMGIFAALAVVLACVGLYGVVAYVVAQRGREIGIRMALGARREQVARMVLTQGLRPAILGVGLGLGLALAFGRVVESVLFELSPRDPLILAAVVGVLSAVAFAASLLPARRASRIEHRLKHRHGTRFRRCPRRLRRRSVVAESRHTRQRVSSRFSSR